ncbi:regulation of nuclear pre-mRNA domain-containing protein 2-like isoform X1 [Carcharodon carcharias]|uniref:regulation of nuclear pre-mRNA domain-containing protein 2-like isoform X1 n=1 Tax=Carcharodon carcharias TaxID=13397 RepID=UPI001B7F32D8|nr:regulation of nuclear pre-mRNA domain-containing protein 2-like isoform X1 [Carcharodon carcharias]
MAAVAAAAAAGGAGGAAVAGSSASSTTTTTSTSSSSSSITTTTSSTTSSSLAALEATLEKKLLTVTNTMDGIQGLSSWILDNKKHYTSIVKHWMKCMRKSSIPHRLNLFYVANDVIQNCKRKNAIIFRDAFSEVLIEAGTLVRDPSIRKSVERIFTIWEQRSVYPEELIVDLRAALVGRKPAEFTKVKTDSTLLVHSSCTHSADGRKSDIRHLSNKTRVVVKSKILAEFRPQALIDQLGSYKQAEDEREFKEKQLGTLRVDVCSTETLKRLKDRAGGKRFSKDFEESSSKLEDFCAELEREVKKTPPLIEALENAEIFYEAQYKEVKIVANAYKTFANRVNNLKKKLDQLKTTLPDPDESPIPSPSMDAPSPTGSESPVRPVEDVVVEPKKVEESPGPPTPEASGDNCDVEDMELSDDEAAGAVNIIAVESEEKKEESSPNAAATASVSPQPEKASVPAETTQAKSNTSTPPLALPNLANIDLGKISSILSSLTTAMKNTVSPVVGQTPVLAVTSAAPSSGLQLNSGMKAPVQKPSPVAPNPLASILSKVELTPESILSALSKTQGPSAPALQGLSSLLQSVTGNTSVPSSSAAPNTPTPAVTNVTSPVDKSVPIINASTQSLIQGLIGCSPNSPASEVSSGSSVNSAPVNHSPALSNTSLKAPANTTVLESSLRSTTSGSRGSMISQKSSTEAVTAEAEAEPSSPSSLELKIHNFLKVNPGFKALDLNIPLLSNLGSSDSKSLLQPSEGNRNPSSTILDNQDGTPVRDERGGTPTQDEIMDKPATPGTIDPMSLLSKLISPPSSSTSSTISPPLSLPQNRDSSYSEISNTVPSYQSNASYNRGRSPFPSSFKPSEMWEESSPHRDSPQEQFYSGESCTDFDYAGPPPSVKQPPKSILKSNKPADQIQSPNEYQSISTSYSRLKSVFSKPMKSILKKQEAYGSRSSSSRGYGDDDQGVEHENLPSPGQNNQFFPESNNIILQPSFSDLSRTGSLQKAFSDTLCSAPSHQPSSSQSVSSFSRTSVASIEKAVSLGSPVSATSTIEFKNMLKNASRRPTDDKPLESPISPAPTGGLSEKGNLPVFGQSGIVENVDEEQHCIETRISTSDLSESIEEKGAPIETLGSSTPSAGRLMFGEPIQTLDSSRGSGRGNMSHGRGGSRSSWFDQSESISDFEDDSSSIDVSEMTQGVPPSFRNQFEEHRLQFPDTSNSFRSNSFNTPFERQTQQIGLPPGSLHDHIGPPPVPTRDHIGHPPGPPPDHVLAPCPPQDHIGPPPVPLRDIGLPPVPPRDHMSLPPGPPPVSHDHLGPPGPPQEHVGVSSGSLRDHGSFSGPPQDHSGPPPGSTHEQIGPPRDHVGPPPGTSVDHIGPPSGPPPDRFGPALPPGPPPRDHLGPPPLDHLGPPPGPPVPPPGPPPRDHLVPPPGPPPIPPPGPPPGPPPRDVLGPPPGTLPQDHLVPPPGPPPRDPHVPPPGPPPQDVLGPLPGSPRDLLGPLAGPPRELLGLLPCPPRDFLGLTNRPPMQRSPRDYYGQPFTPQRDYNNPGRFFQRDFRGSFRPRESFQSGKRPGLPFGNPPYSTAPKRPYMPPRY